MTGGAGPAEEDPVARSILGAIQGVRSRIAAACRRAGRSPTAVRLVGVTKTVSAERVRAARAAGVEDFGENYAADLAGKAGVVSARWHFIGKLQRGTAARVADHADVIHSAVPGEALERVARRVEARGRAMVYLAQVDLVGGRQGVPPDELGSFVRWASAVPGISLSGLMTIPPWTENPEGSRPFFARLRDLRDEIAAAHPEVHELSMGMSGDYEVAVEEGATMVRVGTALFGPRPPRRSGEDARSNWPGRG